MISKTKHYLITSLHQRISASASLHQRITSRRIRLILSAHQRIIISAASHQRGIASSDHIRPGASARHLIKIILLFIFLTPTPYHF
ncbi:MAG: hypothetical protein JRJ39_02830 [Deltaproteobacteria bacterium]|nr:hypothetical protein [Deltaproteobacteria bacterium]